MLNLYIIQTNDFWYDEYDSFVVAAKSPSHCRDIIGKRLADHGHNFDAFMNKNVTTIKQIGVTDRKRAGILHESFNAG